jgi:hypothetical protein
MKSLVFSVLSVMAVLLVFAAYTPAQNTGTLEADCVALATAGAFVVPSTVTPEEACKVLVAFLGQQWNDKAQVQATINLVSEHDVRLVAAEAEIVALKVLVAALQSPIDYQPQIDAINAKLLNVADALQ